MNREPHHLQSCRPMRCLSNVYGKSQGLPLWVQPMTDKYQSLIDATKALSPTTMELEKDPLFENMEIIVTGMLVPTIKAPHGKKRARIVVCGSRLEAIGGGPQGGDDRADGPSLYTRGCDGAAFPCQN